MTTVTSLLQHFRCWRRRRMRAVYKQWVCTQDEMPCRPLFYILSVTPATRTQRPPQRLTAPVVIVQLLHGMRYCSKRRLAVIAPQNGLLSERDFVFPRIGILLLSRNKLGGQQNWNLKGRTLSPTSFSESTFLHTIITASRIANSILAFLNKQHKTYNVYTFICDTVGY